VSCLRSQSQSSDTAVEDLGKRPETLFEFWMELEDDAGDATLKALDFVVTEVGDVGGV
jgi:hypothetical protein